MRQRKDQLFLSHVRAHFICGMKDSELVIYIVRGANVIRNEQRSPILLISASCDH